MPGPLALGVSKQGPEQREALRRVKAWTRERFGLPDDAAILVAEVACGIPGCPPLETVVAFWTQNDRRHHCKVFKPAREIVPDDLPPAWMKDRLIETDIFGCPCC